MNLSENEIIQKYRKIADIAVAILSFHTNMNGLVLHVVTT